ncbi:MAG: DUF3987 domain-containing protein [Leptospirillia bacterium]
MTESTAPEIRDDAPRGEIGKTLFVYRSEGRRALFYAIRSEGSERYHRPDLWGPTADGEKWQSNLKNLPRPLPLYRLSSIQSNSDAPVVFHRSERDVYHAAIGGLAGIHTTNVLGVGYAAATDFSPLCGRDVVICPDNTEDGTRYAEEVAALANAAGANSVNVVRLPGLAEGCGVIEWLHNGGSAEDWAELLAKRGIFSRAESGPDAEQPPTPASGPPVSISAEQAEEEAVAASIEEAFARVLSGEIPQDEMAALHPQTAPETVAAEEQASATDEAAVTSPAETASDITSETLAESRIETAPVDVEATDETIPTPAPLTGVRSPAPPLDPNTLPDAVRDFAADIAARHGCPIDVPASAITVALGAVIGRRMGIHPHAHDSRVVVPNLWGALLGMRPSDVAREALTEALGPLQQLAEQAEADYRKESTAHRARVAAHEVAVASWKRQAAEQAAEDMSASYPPPPEAPVKRRYTTSGGSPEQLTSLLNSNPRGLLMCRDDLLGWVRPLLQGGRETERQFLLSLWRGESPGFDYDAAEDGPLFVKHPCLSVLGWAKVDPFRQLAQGEKGPEASELLSRFQLTVLVGGDNGPGEDRAPDPELRTRATRLFAALDAMGRSTHSEGPIPALHFDEEAQKHADAWRQDMETRLAIETDPAVEAHLAAQRDLMPKLALIFHMATLAERGQNPVPVSVIAARRAVVWCKQLDAHTRNLYDAAAVHELEGARTLLDRLLAGDLKSPFKVRDVYRRHWSRLSTPDTAQAAVRLLEQHDYLTSEPIPTTERGGKPTRVYRLNPQADAGEPVAHNH